MRRCGYRRPIRASLAAIILSVVVVSGTLAQGATTARFSFAPASPVEDQSVQFDASASEGGSTFRWNFTGGPGFPVDAGGSAVAAHVFADEGTYPVSLEVTDAFGTKDTETQTVTVTNAPPVATFGITPNPAETGDPVTFDASASTDEESIVGFVWDLDGDGSFETDTGTQPTTSRTYATAGDRIVRLRVTDNDGTIAEVEHVLRVGAKAGAAPTASFTPPRDLHPGVVADFDASGSTGTRLTFRWEFGGALVDAGTARTVSHGFTVPGDYRVRLVVTDAFGRQATADRVVHVAVEPRSGLTFEPALPRPGEPVRFRLTPKSDASAPVSFFIWNFGDGRPGDQTMGGLRFRGLHPSNAPEVTHRFAKKGVYTVVGKAVMRDGQIAQFTQRVHVGAKLRTRSQLARASAARGTQQLMEMALGQYVADNGADPALGPGMTSPGMPATDNPVNVTMAMPEWCTTEEYGTTKPLAELEARLQGDWSFDPIDQLEDLKNEGFVPSNELGGVPMSGRRARAAATSHTTCISIGTFRVLGMSWGDGKATTVSTPPLDEDAKVRTVSHVYTEPGKRTITATVRVALNVFAKGGARTITLKPSLTIDVVKSYCGPIFLRGVTAVVSGGDASCWVPGAMGYQSPTGQATIGGMVVRATKGVLAVSGNRPGEPEAPDNGAVTAFEMELEVAGQAVAKAKQFSVPPSQPPSSGTHTMADLVNVHFKVGGLSVEDGDVVLHDNAPPEVALRLMAPKEFWLEGQPTYLETAPAADPQGDAEVDGPDSLPFGSISLPGLSITHDALGWHGGVVFDLGGPALPQIQAEDEIDPGPPPAPISGIGLLDDGTAYLGAEVVFGQPKPRFLCCVTLDKIGIFGSIHPTSFTGTVTLGVIDGSILSVEGGLGMVWPEGSGNTIGTFCEQGHKFSDTKVDNVVKPWTMRMCGTPRLLNAIDLASGFAQLEYGDLFSFGGGVSYAIGPGWFTAQASIAGSFTNPSQWQANAHGEVCEHLIDDTCLEGDLWVTPIGAAGCVDLWVADVGAYIQWDGDMDYFMRSCGSRAPHYIGAARAAMLTPTAIGAALAPIIVPIPGGEPWHVIEVRGQGAAPLVKITGPGGRTFTDSGAKRQCVRPNGAPTTCPATTRHNGILRSDAVDSTLVYINKPQPGDWKVIALPGSAPITRVRHAAGLDEPQLASAVTKKNGKYTVSLKRLAQPGMKVTLVERDTLGHAGSLITPNAKGASTLAPVAHAARRFETVRFRPRAGLGRKRRLVANISVDGIPWRSVTLVRYTAPPPVQPTPPRRVRATRTPSGLRVTWMSGRAAARYQVAVTTGAGRTIIKQLSGRRRTLLVRDYRPTEGATISVRTVRADGFRLPKAATAKVKPTAPKPIVITLGV